MRKMFVLSAIVIGVAPLGGGSGADAQVPDPVQNGESFVGHWIGTLEIPGTDIKLRLLFRVREEDGGLTATLVSLDQGNAESAVETIQAIGATLSMSIPAIGVSFEGTLADDGDTIEGSFTQRGNTLPLVLERTSEEEVAARSRRPQDPEEPLPYHSEEVAYSNPDGGHTLAGTFTRPTEGGPFPAVVLISGSGPQDRNEALVGHRPFLVLSDHLTRNGIAVLRFDDRGVGESKGDFDSATSRDFASDVLAGVAYLTTREDVKQRKIGLAGHSEGGLIAPMVAVESEDVSYIVLMAAPGVNGERILYTQSALILRANGVPEEKIAENTEQQRVIFEIVKREADPEVAAREIGDYVRAQLKEVTEEERVQAGVTDEASLERVVATQVQAINSPWFRYFLVHDPAAVIEQVTVPVLAVTGEKDLQVPHEENLREIEAALKRGGNTRYEIHALPDHNHLFQHAETGAPNEYQEIDETWSVASMELITNWILKTVETIGS